MPREEKITRMSCNIAKVNKLALLMGMSLVSQVVVFLAKINSDLMMLRNEKSCDSPSPKDSS